MRGFYILLGVVVVAGGAWLAYSAGRHPAAPTQPGPEPLVTDSFPGYTMGSDAAPVTITEYADYECPYCAAFATVQMPEIRRQLIATGKVRWRFRDFPLASHKYSRTAALAAQCAGEQGKFWEMHDQLFSQHQWAQTGKNPTDLFRSFAQQLSLDVAKYDACLATERYARRIQASRQEGEALAIQGTPSLFVNGRLYQGHLTSDAIKATVDSLTAHRKR